MKTVYTGRELPHVWAHQIVPYGRAGSTSFEGLIFRSYWARIGRLLLKRGRPAGVILSTRIWSQTTQRHQSQLRQATSHLAQFSAGNVDAEPAEVLAEYAERIETAGELVLRARSNKRWRLRALQGLVAEANAYAKFIGSRRKFKPTIGTAAEQLKADELDKREAEKRAAARKAAKSRAIAEYPGRLADYRRRLELWRMGEINYVGHPPRNPEGAAERPPIYLRHRDGRIETSAGAVVPLAAAVRLLPVIRGDSTEPVCVPPYGEAAFDMDERTVTIGCHELQFGEILRLADSLGL